MLTTESPGAAARRRAAQQTWFTPARQFLLLTVLLIGCLAVFSFVFQARIRRLEEATLGDQHEVHLTKAADRKSLFDLPGDAGWFRRGSGSTAGLKNASAADCKGVVDVENITALALASGGELCEFPCDPDRIRWKREPYPEPLDLDDTVAARAMQINASWNALSEEERAGKYQPGFQLNFPVDDPPYPFQRVSHRNGSDTGILALIAPMFDTNFYKAEGARALFWHLKAKGHIIIGIASYQEFPGRIVNPFDDRHTIPKDDLILANLDGWMHCFREPAKVLAAGIPRILLSESDFHDPWRDDKASGGGSLLPENVPKKYDIFYSNQAGNLGEWQDFCRNWTLAKASFINLAKAIPTIKIVVMNRNLTKDPEDEDLRPYLASGNVIEHVEEMNWNDFVGYIDQSRILMTPNMHDGSPRVLAEALCKNVPILVNRAIVGGWKYVQPDTGEFFDNEHNVVDAVKLLLSPGRQATLRPRQWYLDHSGRQRASVLFQAFMELAVGKERLAAAQARVDKNRPYIF